MLNLFRHGKVTIVYNLIYITSDMISHWPMRNVQLKLWRKPMSTLYTAIQTQESEGSLSKSWQPPFTTRLLNMSSLLSLSKVSPTIRRLSVSHCRTLGANTLCLRFSRKVSWKPKRRSTACLKKRYSLPL